MIAFHAFKLGFNTNAQMMPIQNEKHDNQMKNPVSDGKNDK